MPRRPVTQAAAGEPAPSFLDWPSAPGTRGGPSPSRWKDGGERVHRASGGLAWLLALGALLTLYALSWRYLPY